MMSVQAIWQHSPPSPHGRVVAGEAAGLEKPPFLLFSPEVGTLRHSCFLFTHHGLAPAMGDGLFACGAVQGRGHNNLVRFALVAE